MSIVLLVGARGDADAIMPWRVRLRDRVATRVRAFGLDGALAQGVAPESSPALELRATTLIGPAAWQLGDHLRQILLTVNGGARLPIHAVPISHRLIRAVEPELWQLALRLLDDRPVDVRGVASVRALLCDGHGPLYGAGDRDAGELRNAVTAAIDALEILA
jgi:hypothetical protein